MTGYGRLTNCDTHDGLAQALFEESHAPLLLVHSGTGRVVDANAAVQRLCGASVRSLREKAVQDLFRVGGDGWAGVFPMAVRKVELPRGRQVCLARTFRDRDISVSVLVTRLAATARPLALVRVRESRDPPRGTNSLRRGRGVLAAAPACLWGAKVMPAGEGRFIYMSPGISRVAGRVAGGFGRGLHAWRNVIHPEDQPVWDEGLRRRRAGETTLDEYRIVWPDRSVRWVQDLARAVHGAAGRHVELYGVFTDVTARKRAEAATRFREPLPPVLANGTGSAPPL